MLTVILKEEAKGFLAEHPLIVRQKFVVAFRKTCAGHKGHWFKKLTDSDGLFEFRVEVATNIYRLFAFWDTTSAEQTLIVCTHGFQKKTDKTPSNELEKAARIKREYFSKI